MAIQLDQNGKDDLKTQFITREGTYRLILSDSRPTRVGYQSNQNSPQVKVSFVSLPTAPLQLQHQQSRDSSERGGTLTLGENEKYE
jgi:hypothetical protein